MKSIQGNTAVNTSTWVELEETFDLVCWSVYSDVAIYVQEYGISGWGSSISIEASDPYLYNTSVKKIRIMAQTVNGTVKYSLVGFITYRVNGTSGLISPISEKTSNYTITSSDYSILVNALSNAVTITLPTAIGIEGQLFNIKSIDDTYTCDVATYGSETIDGDSDNFELIKDESITLQSDGSGWRIL